MENSVDAGALIRTSLVGLFYLTVIVILWTLFRNKLQKLWKQIYKETKPARTSLSDEVHQELQEESRKKIDADHKTKAADYEERILRPREEARKAQIEEEFRRFTGPAWKGKSQPLGDSDGARDESGLRRRRDGTSRDAAGIRKLPENKKNVTLEEEKTKPKRFTLGQLVWGHLKGFPWWPGKIVHYTMMRREPPPPGHVTIQWYGDMKFSLMKTSQVRNFCKEFQSYINTSILKKRNLYKKAMFQALKVAAEQAKKTFKSEVSDYPKGDATEEQLKQFKETFDEMIAWAEEALPQEELLPLAEDLKEPLTPLHGRKLEIINLPEEPPEETPESVTIALRGLINVKKRRFLKKEKIQVLLDWMAKHGYHPRLYTLCTTYPRQDLSLVEEKSLEEAGLDHDTVVIVEEIDHDAS